MNTLYCPTTRTREPAALLALAFFLMLSISGDVEAKKRKRKNRGKWSSESSKVCAIFDADPARAAMGPGLTITPSSASPSCLFKVRVPDADALERAYVYAKAIKGDIDLPIKALHPSIAARISILQSKRRYTQLKGPPVEDLISAVSEVDLETKVFKEIRPRIEDMISVTYRGDAATVTLAKSAVKQLQELVALQSTIDALNVAGTDEAYYVLEHHSLIARKGKRVITVTVDIRGKSDEGRKELLVTLAKKWLNQ